MVQLSPTTIIDVSAPSECSRAGLPSHKAGSSKMGSTGRLKTLQMDLEASDTIYQGYDCYIEDGLICLKHKIRNIEKKKIKLEDYLNRLKQGESLNKDQLEAVEKYDEIIHNLSFAQQLHKTLDGLTQDLLKAQRKAVRKEQVARVEAERRLLCTILQVQHLLLSLQHEHIRKDLLSGLNLAPHLPAPELQSLLDLASLLAVKRDEHFSLENQMERAAVVYLELMEGGDKPVAGSTYKILKEQLYRLLHCGYFDLVSTPPVTSLKEMEAPMVKKTSANVSNSIKDSQSDLEPKTSPTQNWKVEFQAIKEQEPPDSWAMEFSEMPVSLQCAIQKPWRGAAVFIPKVPMTIKKQAIKPQMKKKKKKKKKSKGEQGTKATFVEVYNSPSALPKDPALREQHLEDLMTKIQGSFIFLQDSDLESKSSPTNGHTRLGRGSTSFLAQNDPKTIPAEVLIKTLHCTQPESILEHRASLTNGEEFVDDCDLDLNVEKLADEPLHLQDCEVFPLPLLYRHGSSLSNLEEKIQPPTPVLKSGKQSPCNVGDSRTQPFSTLPATCTKDMDPPETFHNKQSVFKLNAPLPSNGDVDYNCKTGVFAEAIGLQYISASTQTPPEFALPEDEVLLPAYQSEYVIGNGGQVYLPQSQSGGNMGLAGQSYYTRGSSRGMARGKGQAQSSSFRSAGGPRGGLDWNRCGVHSPRGGFNLHVHHRDAGTLPYGARDGGYPHCYKHGGGPGGTRHNSSGRSDSSQVSSPDRETNYTLVDSAHGDSISVSTMELPVTPQGHTLLPMQLYPLPQPLRVAFTSARTVNFAPGTLDQPIAFDLLHSNLGDMFDTQLGRFTCPANGTYVFIFHILKLAVNVPLYINLMRNEEVMVSAYANDGAPDHETASNHAILPLYQGDQVWLRLHRGAIYGSSWKYSTFSGFLLYQD